MREVTGRDSRSWKRHDEEEGKRTRLLQKMMSNFYFHFFLPSSVSSPPSSSSSSSFSSSLFLSRWYNTPCCGWSNGTKSGVSVRFGPLQPATASWIQSADTSVEAKTQRLRTSQVSWTVYSLNNSSVDYLMYRFLLCRFKKEKENLWLLNVLIKDYYEC